MRGGDSRGIAVAIVAIVRTLRSDVFALWRLRELPDFGESNTALSRAWRASGRIYRKRAAGRGRADIVDRPVNDLASGGALANVFGGNYVAVVSSGNAGAVNAGAESGGGDGVDPGVDVGFLLGQHASALLLVEEDDSGRGKALALC